MHPVIVLAVAAVLCCGCRHLLLLDEQICSLFHQELPVSATLAAVSSGHMVVKSQLTH